MGKILLLYDTHGRPFWRDAVEKHMEECEHVLFGGDYLDPYQDEEEPVTRKESMKSLDDIIELKRNNMEKVILLLGNHDGHYLYRDFGKSTRYDSSNAFHNKETLVNNKTLFKVAWDKMIKDTRYLFTHAGVCRSWYERHKEDIGELTAENLNKSFNVKDWSEYSRYRGWLGYDVGSPMWSDVRERFGKDGSETEQDIEGIFNVFGHTRLKHKPYISKNWACLDAQKAFIMDDEGNISEV